MSRSESSALKELSSVITMILGSSKPPFGQSHEPVRYKRSDSDYDGDSGLTKATAQDPLGFVGTAKL